ncbi:MAG: MBL fold metallo-hydrolase [Candidatus Promineifilaceae bacterium]|nr:MBL fold metallo-hydrolase [Candidatus Promineifilaceae bacterium]
MHNIHPFNIGDLQCWALNDGTMAADSAFLFDNAPDDELAQVLKRDNLDPDHLPSPLTCLLIQTAMDLVLVDTGFGPGSDTAGRLLDNLQQAGFAAEEVTKVILTHVHSDHVGGCLDARGNIAYPQATFYMDKAEWDFWTTESTLRQAPQWAAKLAREKLPPLARKMELLDQETEIAPGVTAVPAPGHTAGHLVVELSSGGQTLLNLADAALHPLQVEFPHWNALLDMFPEQTVATRQALYSRAAAKNELVLAFHFSPFPSLGYIREKVGRFHWTPS